MTSNPKTISQEALFSSALSMMNEFDINALIVTDDDQLPIGIVHLHDMLRTGAA